MNILTVPLRNTGRKPWRTILLLTVFTLGVTAVAALVYVSQVVGESFEKKLTAYGANILVAPHTETLTVSYGGFTLGDLLVDVRHLPENATVSSIHGIELNRNLSAVAPKLVVMTRVGQTAVGLVGVRWEPELAMKSFWAVTGAYPKADNEILAGASAADKLGLVPGATLDLMGRTMIVSGVLAPTGGEDDKVLLADLGVVQDLSGQPDRISFVEVAALCSACPIEDIVAQLAQALPDTDIKALRNVVASRMYSVHFVQRLILIVSLVILLTACAMIGLSMLSAVNERKREIGILRSLGYARSAIFAIFCFEGLIIGATAGAIGYTAGFFLSRQVLAVMHIAEQAELHFSFGHLLLSMTVISLLAVISAALPARKASRVEPSEALISL